MKREQHIFRIEWASIAPDFEMQMRPAAFSGISNKTNHFTFANRGFFNDDIAMVKTIVGKKTTAMLYNDQIAHRESPFRKNHETITGSMNGRADVGHDVNSQMAFVIFHRKPA